MLCSPKHLLDPGIKPVAPASPALQVNSTSCVSHVKCKFAHQTADWNCLGSSRRDRVDIKLGVGRIGVVLAVRLGEISKGNINGRRRSWTKPGAVD